MATKLGGRKRTDGEREQDLVFIQAARLRKEPPGKILRDLNERVILRNTVALQAQGFAPEKARELAEDFALSTRTLEGDFKAVKKRLRAAVTAGGEALVIQRLQELELERQTLLHAEQRAWQEVEKGDRDEEERTERLEPVEVEEKGPDGNPVLGPDGRPVTRKMLRPRDLANRKSVRPLNPVWIEKVVQCVAARVAVTREMFELSALLSRPYDLPSDLQNLEKDRAAAEALLARELAFLCSAEARATGRNVDEARIRLLTSFVQRRGGGGDIPPGAGSGEPFGFTIKILEGGQTPAAREAAEQDPDAAAREGAP